MYRITGLFLILSLILIQHFGCKRSTSPPNPNMPPNTTLSNLPVPNDTLFPLVQITWDGGDDDGYIVGCEYRYFTEHLYKGDTAFFDWVRTEKQIIDIIFESSDVLNRQHLFVRAIDNDGAVDPTPAELVIYTPQTVLPVSTILFPQDGNEFFYLENTTDWWEGVQLIYSAYDEDGEVVEYGWSIDNHDWTWTQDTALFITPDMFEPPLEGLHTIRVTAKDNTNLFDPQGEEITIRLVKPQWTNNVLLIDETDEQAFPVTVKDSDAKVDSVFNAIFQPDTSWDVLNDGMPPKSVLGRYKLIVWMADNPTSLGPHLLPQYADILKDYLNVGGNLIVSGWGVIKSFAYDENFPKTFTEGSFMRDYLHINIADESPFFPGDFTGAVGVNGFSNVTVDGERIWSFPYVKKLSSVTVVKELGGFTEPIFIYTGENPNYVGETCGIRYFGTDFNVIVLGFPIYFLKDADRQQLAQELLQGIQYE